MDTLPVVAYAHSVSIEFTNDSGEYRATLDVRPGSGQMGAWS